MQILRILFPFALSFSGFVQLAHATPTSSLETLLSAPTTEAFQQALEEAKKAGLSQQAQLEVRFLHYVDRQDNAALAKLSTELLASKDSFRAEDSSIFSLKEDWLAIIQYTQALAALQNGDTKGFESHIKEAFWLSPRQASAFAPHIDKHRLDLAMAQLQLPADIKLPLLHGDKNISLIAPETKATLLYFWSPWSREFDETTSFFKALCAESQKHKIQFTTVLAEQSEEVEKDARTVIAEKKLLDACSWCTDSTLHKLSSTLRIQSAPTAVLITPNGSILFNGHPSSPDLLKALKPLAADFQMPTISLEK